MKISDQWLRTFISTDLTPEKISPILTDLGLEIEGVETYESVKGSLEGIVVGQVLTCGKHPNADKLSVTTVNIGSEEALPIVCGAPNVAAGQKVAVATVGTTLYTKDGESFKIKKAKLRGEPSEGMLCAEDELGLGNSHEGIMVLPEDYTVGAPLAEYFPIAKDQVYEIGLTPNRTDAMSHFGVARDLQAFLSSKNLQHQLVTLQEEKISSNGTHDFAIEIEDENLVPRYLGAVIENIQVAPSPQWLQNQLKAIGLAPINNVVDITNYILHSYGQPLHAFDASKIANHKVVVGLSKAGEKFTTLDGVERNLKGTEIMIKDGAGNPMCIAGVFGGEKSGVTNNTTSIFLESAYFNPVAIRKAAKAHGLNTDASFRFERGIDPNLTRYALIEAVKLIEEHAGGVLKGDILEFYPKEIEDFQVILRYSKLDKILGTRLHREEIKKILTALDITILNEINDGLELSVPPYRADVTREIDVIEEILRVYGYNKVPVSEKIAYTPVSLALDNQNALENFWARSLQSNGFYEVLNNSLVTANDESKDAVTLLNPLSRELSTMRQSLLDGLLANADFNIKRKNANIKFFELGKIYFKHEKYEERKQLALLVSGNQHEENWAQKTSPVDFFTLKGSVQQLLSKLGVSLQEKPAKDNRFSDLLEISAENTVLARIGVVSENRLKKADIEQPVYYAEIELEACQQLRQKGNFKFQELPKFNTLRRDLALLVDKSVNYQDLVEATEGLSKSLQKVQLFDVYEGKNIPEGKKSYALSFELLNREKTLDENAINSIMKKLIKTFEKKFGAEIRS